jgi:hypothetical protein
LWELFSRGMIPYFTKTNSEAIESVLQGYRLPRPEECPENIYGLILSCWKTTPAERPTFDEILEKLSAIHTERNPEKPRKSSFRTEEASYSQQIVYN